MMASVLHLQICGFLSKDQGKNPISHMGDGVYWTQVSRHYGGNFTQYEHSLCGDFMREKLREARILSPRIILIIGIAEKVECINQTLFSSLLFG